jgi:hypothetical protein
MKVFGFVISLVLVRSILGIPSSDWLSAFPDDYKIVDIPLIPGSHNSASARTRMAVGIHQVARQQSLSIQRQLEAGVRLIDLRVRYDEQKSIIRVVHTLDLSYTLAAAVSEISNFLSAHPSEFVVVMLRGDWPPSRSFAPDSSELKDKRVGELVNVLKSSGINWARNDEM